MSLDSWSTALVDAGSRNCIPGHPGPPGVSPWLKSSCSLLTLLVFIDGADTQPAALRRSPCTSSSQAGLRGWQCSM